MPVDLQTPGPSVELTQEFALKGGLKLKLDEVVVPTRAIKDRPRKFAMGFANVAAAVGFRSEFALTNSFTPDFSEDGTVQVHAMWFATASTVAVEVGWPIGPVAGLTVIPSRFTDNARTGDPLAPFGQDNTAVATVADMFLRYDVDVASRTYPIVFDPHPIIIRAQAPRSLIIRPASSNTQLTLTLLWSEPADPA